MFVNIECPACRVAEISLEPSILAQGGSFSCNGCGAEISVANQSKKILQDSVKKYAEYNNKLKSHQEDGNRPL